MASTSNSEEEEEEVTIHEYRVTFVREREEGTFNGYSYETARNSSEAVDMFLDWVRENSVAEVEEYTIVESERTNEA